MSNEFLAEHICPECILNVPKELSIQLNKVIINDDENICPVGSQGVKATAAL